MNYEIKWYVPNRVLHLHISGKIGYQENADMNAKLTEQIHEGQAPVHLIIELGKDVTVPVDISALSKGTPIRDKMVGRAVLVGANGILRFLGQMVANLAHADVKLVGSMDDVPPALLEIEPNLHIPTKNGA
jgi:hypothetical protein